MAKRASLLLCFLCTLVFLSGCSGITAEMIDSMGVPDNIYHSGNDLLSGEYEVLPKPDNTKDKPAPFSLQKDDKGWKISQPDSPSLHLFEYSPEDMRGIIRHFDPKTMQCIGRANTMICKAPKGTKVHSKKLTVTSETGYVIMVDKDWDNVRKK